MQTVYIGNTLVNDVMLGSQRMDDVTLSDTYLVEYLIVAGGGGGGLGGGTGGEGGGGAGGMITGSLITKVSSTNYSVTVGTGGGVSNAGNNSVFLSKTALGGGRGGSVGAENGGNGGSGGGSYITTGGTTYTPGTGLQPTEADVGYGNNGSVGARFSPTNFFGGSGGGAGSAASSTSAGGARGWLDGNSYCAGGPGENASGGSSSRGSGGGANAAGQAGVVIVRYFGIPIGTGGTITQSGGYTYHTFTGNSTFTF